jgi:hypothetical protein
MIKKTDQESGEQKILEAREIIEALGLPRQQQNERSALTLLSLLDLKPADRWEDAGNPLIGITPMMGFFETAFHDRHKMMKYLDEISWETEAWVAESPTHLIHFNGERFLGPYEEGSP